MIKLLCTCNGTISLTEKDFKKIKGGESDIYIYDNLCQIIDEVLEDIPIGQSGLFIGCKRENELFSSAADSVGVPINRMVTFDLPRLLADFKGETARQLTSAYLAASQVLINKQNPAIPKTIAVGPRILISGNSSGTVAKAISKLMDVIWIGTDQPPEGVKAINGKVSAVKGTIGNFQIKIDTKTAVNPVECVECGACRSICPLGAINKDYLINMNLCDSCGKCEEECRIIGAINLNRDELEVEVDQVILLDTAIAERAGFYCPKTSEDAMATAMEALTIANAGEIQVSPVVGFNEEKCAHSYAEQQGCTKCISNCPTKAITSENKTISINHDLCSGCLTCTSSCPTGAIYAKPWNGNIMGEALTVFAANAKMAPLVITCGDCQSNHKLPGGHIAFPYPQYATIEASHILSALLAGAPAISLMPCPACETNAYKEYQLAKEVLGRCDCDLIYWQEEVPEKIKSSSIKDAPFKWTGKREAFGSSLHPFIANSSGEHPPLHGDFSQIAINSQLCTGCGACMEACRTGALTGDSDKMIILSREISCISCGLCAKVCPEKAINLVPGLRWNNDVFEQKTAAACEGLGCRKCGKVFATKKAIESVVSRLAHKLDKNQQEVLYLCPDCRVVTTLMEEENV